MSNSPQCVAYLNAKKEYVKQLNYKLASQPNLWNDVMQNNFDQIDKLIDNNVIREWSDSSENLKQFFFSDRIDDSGRKDIVNAILHPPHPYDRYLYVRTSEFEFLLIRKYDLPFIHDFLKMELIDRAGDRGFEGLRNSELFNEILEIKGDKFVLHSGVKRVKQVLGFFSKARGQQHCPLIVSLIRLMDQHHIPFDSSRPEVRRCITQQETEFKYVTEVTEDNDMVNVSREQYLIDPDNIVSTTPTLKSAALRSVAPSSVAPSSALSAALRSAAAPPHEQVFNTARFANPNLVSLNKIGKETIEIVEGGRTKQRKISKRVARTRKTRRTRRTRKSLRKH
jgi:hypothetical protein